MKILLLGKNGMLGSQFKKQFDGFGENFEITALDRDELDVTDEDALSQVFVELSPDIVINCTGYTAVDEAESHREEAFNLNANAPRKIAQLCDKNGAVLIHFSTDYVFDGQKDVETGGYDEESTPNPLSVYGESKLKGEEFIQSEMTRYFIIRTSWLYGPRPSTSSGGHISGGNFVDTMLRLGKEVLSGDRDRVRVVGDQFGSPTYTVDLVRAVIHGFFIGWPDKIPAFGIYHLTGDGVCSWHEFAVQIFELAGLKVAVEKISTSEYKTEARRPKNSMLTNTKLPKMSRWEKALEAYHA